MQRLCAMILSLCLPLVLIAQIAHADGPPSKGAKGMKGALGTFDFKPSDWKKGQTTYLLDTDGVKPGEAGCHIGTNKKGKPNGRSFGEACLSKVLLVESNPGAKIVHSHKNDVGHPDKFDCNAWCIGKGSAKGTCVAAAAPPCAASAKCICQ